MKTVKVKINPSKDRENLVTALINTGYKVWIEEINEAQYPPIQLISYYVCFEVKKEYIQ